MTDGPQLLAEALANLGVHTLPHRPEVREQFARVLDSPRGEEFQAALREQLLHSDVELRWGAAAVLLAYDPLQQSEALLVTVQTQPALDDTAGNWSKFCLTLNLGPVPLQQLKESLPTLPQQARLFALVILYVRGVLDDGDLRNELFRALLGPGGWLLNYEVPGPAILADPAAKPLLLAALDDDDAAVAARAGERLRSYHFDALTLTEQATCLVQCVTAGNLHYSQDDLVARLRTDAPFAEAVNQVPMRGSAVSVLQALARAIADPSQWAAVLWEFMHQPNSNSFDDEDLLVLDSIGQCYAEYGQPIGEAALALRKDKDRWRTRYQPDAMQWLTLR